jgi:hypothetical protein
MAEFRGSRRKLVRVTPDVQAIFCPPSPPAEKASARQDQARKTSARDGAGDGSGRDR